MARTARERHLYGTYHVWQIAATNEVIFRDDTDRQAFSDALMNVVNQYPSEVLAYCLIADDQYHLILRFFGCDISRFMSSLNIRYSRGLSRSGLFRDRFQSELLDSPQAVEAVLQSLRERSRQAKEWNSFCHLDQKSGRMISLTLNNKSVVDAASPALNIASQDTLKTWLTDMLAEEGLSYAEMLRDKPLRNTWVYRARRSSTVTLKELGEVFGVSESMVSKIIGQGAPRV